MVSRTADLLREVWYESVVPTAVGGGLFDGWERLYAGARQISQWTIAVLRTIGTRPAAVRFPAPNEPFQ